MKRLQICLLLLICVIGSISTFSLPSMCLRGCCWRRQHGDGLRYTCDLQVEQDRFTVKPFSMGQQNDPERYERTATMCVRRGNPMERSGTMSAFQASK